MRTPLVSVCLPNLNTRPYLEERVATVRAQTYSNWELVVSDNHSEDGSWRFFEELARSDGRVSIARAPREGMYANWNRCIARARGEFVYIATSDDTMAPDCLEKLVAALLRHPECDVAHCALKRIDARGCDLRDRWSQTSAFAVSSGSLLHRPHIRRAPFDGLLHLLGGSVYVSITQLLIRRSLFDRIGPFESRWGSIGDFNWNMRAGLVAHTVHVPDTWGGWRVHGSQATAGVRFRSREHAAHVDDMVDHAIRTSEPHLAPWVRQRLATCWASEAKQIRELRRELGLNRETSLAERAAFLWRCVCSGSAPARDYLISRVLRRSPYSQVHRWLEAGGADGPLLSAVLDGSNAPVFEGHPSLGATR